VSIFFRVSNLLLPKRILLSPAAFFWVEVADARAP